MGGGGRAILSPISPPMAANGTAYSRLGGDEGGYPP
jgi:hypothetical protein